MHRNYKLYSSEKKTYLFGNYIIDFVEDNNYCKLYCVQYVV